jgi:hypothetical protein
MALTSMTPSGPSQPHIREEPAAGGRRRTGSVGSMPPAAVRPNAMVRSRHAVALTDPGVTAPIVGEPVGRSIDNAVARAAQTQMDPSWPGT